jgi:hypothetical protein
LLEPISTEVLQSEVFRLASQQRNVDFLREQGFDDESVNEMLDLLKARGISDKAEDLCDGPFRSKPRLQKAGYLTRFSDGTFPVFYSALEPETAEAEIRYWFLKIAGKPTRPRAAYYSRFSCTFDGSIKDLRPMHAEWPNLTHDSDYRFCNSLGTEAVTSRLDGLVTPSARNSNGTNIPVFQRRAISSPVIHALVVVTLDPSTGEAEITEL